MLECPRVLGRAQELAGAGGSAPVAGHAATGLRDDLQGELAERARTVTVWPARPGETL